MNENLIKLKDAIMHPDKRIMKSLWMIGGIVVIVLIILLVLKVTIFSKISTSRLEDKMIISAKKYYSRHKEQLPEFDKDTATVSIDNLIDEGYLKPLDKLLKNKNTTCTGTVTVTNNNNYYLYSPNIVCSDKYRTKKLYEVITDAGNVVTNGDGLYELDGNYIYRGEKVNNFIQFAGQTWRILRVNSNDNSIKLIEVDPIEKLTVWDDRYNSGAKFKAGINDYTVSRIKETLTDIWTRGTFNDHYKSYISTQDLCIGTRASDEMLNDGSVECAITDGITSLSMITPSDYLIISLDNECQTISDKQCTNYNYLANLKYLYWTITADANSSYKVYAINQMPKLIKANTKTNIRLSINLSSDTNYLSGNGTEDKPYIIR